MESPLKWDVVLKVACLRFGLRLGRNFIQKFTEIDPLSFMPVSLGRFEIEFDRLVDIEIGGIYKCADFLTHEPDFPEFALEPLHRIGVWGKL